MCWEWSTNALCSRVDITCDEIETHVGHLHHAIERLVPYEGDIILVSIFSKEKFAR